MEHLNYLNKNTIKIFDKLDKQIKITNVNFNEL